MDFELSLLLSSLPKKYCGHDSENDQKIEFRHLKETIELTCRISNDVGEHQQEYDDDNGYKTGLVTAT